MTNPAPSDTEQEIRDMEHKWLEAHLHLDVKLFDELMSDAFIFTGPDGSVQDRTQVLSNFETGAYSFDSFNMDDIHVYSYGEAAVSSGRILLAGSFQGQDMTGNYRYTNVYAKPKGRWQIVAVQANRIL
jgi:ketosteroid isomerase-like protein